MWHHLKHYNVTKDFFLSVEDGKLYLWGKNASQVIRTDESSRFFQFEPYHVHLGVWKALKVSY